MATTAFSREKYRYADLPADFGSAAASCFRRVGEWFWFLVSFLLFVVLGPFSAPVVLIVLARLGMEDNCCEEPQTIGSR